MELGVLPFDLCIVERPTCGQSGSERGLMAFETTPVLWCRADSWVRIDQH